MPERMVMVRDMTTDTDMELPLPELLAHDGRYRVLVWDEEAGEFAAVHRLEAARGGLRYAESLGPGTPACFAASERAMELAGEDGLWRGNLSRKARKKAGA